MWVDLTQSVEGLNKSKDWYPSRRGNSATLELQHWLFPSLQTDYLWIWTATSMLLCFPVCWSTLQSLDLPPFITAWASFLKHTLSLFLCIPLVLFLWRTLTNTIILNMLHQFILIKFDIEMSDEILIIFFSYHSFSPFPTFPKEFLFFKVWSSGLVHVLLDSYLII